MDWATERSLPIREYLEFEDQPANKTENTIKDLIQKNIKNDKLRLNKKYKEGKLIHKKRERNKARWGEKL